MRISSATPAPAPYTYSAAGKPPAAKPKATDRPETPPPPEPDPLFALFDGIGGAIKGVVGAVAGAAGKLIEGIFGGGKGKADGPDGAVHELRPGDTSNKKPVLFVNGAGTNQAEAISQATKLSGFLGRDGSSRDIDLVHNATDIPQHQNGAAQAGAFLGHFERDVSQVRSDFRGGPNAAAGALSQKLLERLRGDDEPIEVAAVSQGTIIARNAIEAAMNERRRELSATLPADEVERRLAADLDRIHYANIAGAVNRSDFPAGLTHYIDVHDDRDPVVNLLGANRGNISADTWDRRAANIALELAGPNAAAHGAILSDTVLQARLRDFYPI